MIKSKSVKAIVHEVALSRGWGLYYETATKNYDTAVGKKLASVRISYFEDTESEDGIIVVVSGNYESEGRNIIVRSLFVRVGESETDIFCKVEDYFDYVDGEIKDSYAMKLKG